MMDNMYDPDKLESEAAQKKLMIDTAVDVQAVLQLLIAKEIISVEELQAMRNKVRGLPKYKASYEYIASIHKASETWKNNPNEYLKAVLDAKMKK